MSVRPCNVEWPVCQHCLGEGLTQSGGEAWCTKCQRRWPVSDVVPCRAAATVTITDEEGKTGVVCASHAEHASADNFEKKPLVGAPA